MILFQILQTPHKSGQRRSRQEVIRAHALLATNIVNKSDLMSRAQPQVKMQVIKAPDPRVQAAQFVENGLAHHHYGHGSHPAMPYPDDRHSPANHRAQDFLVDMSGPLCDAVTIGFRVVEAHGCRWVIPETTD